MLLVQGDSFTDVAEAISLNPCYNGMLLVQIDMDLQMSENGS